MLTNGMISGFRFVLKLPKRALNSLPGNAAAAAIKRGITSPVWGSLALAKVARFALYLDHNVGIGGTAGADFRFRALPLRADLFVHLSALPSQWQDAIKATQPNMHSSKMRRNFFCKFNVNRPLVICSLVYQCLFLALVKTAT
jgi:hypothetical protein